jgi:hypothetical protein
MIPTQRSIDRLGGLNTTFHFESTVSRVFNYAVERTRYELRDNPLHSLQLRTALIQLTKSFLIIKNLCAMFSLLFFPCRFYFLKQKKNK